MLMLKINSIIILLYLLAPPVYSQNDIPGSKDNPLIPRFPGAEIIFYDERQEDNYFLPLGPLIKNNFAVLSAKEPYIISQNKKLRGRTIRIQYKIKTPLGGAAIYDHYRKKISEAEFEIIISSDGKSPNEIGGKSWCHYAYASLPQNLKLNLSGSKSKIERGYISSELRKRGGEIYLTAMINQWNTGEVYVQLDMIEVKPAGKGREIITAGKIAGELKNEGHISLYGIQFGEKGQDLLPESESVLAEIAEYLKQNNNINLYIVGHTDTGMNLEASLYLSKIRAKTVLNALAGRHGIALNRLSSEGVGPYSPVSTNATPEGRNLNNRIELVVKPN